MTEERLNRIRRDAHLYNCNQELLAYVDQLRSEFTTDVSIDHAFQELFTLGKEFKIPEFVLKEWKVKWLERHLRFHHAKEKDLAHQLTASERRWADHMRIYRGAN